MCCMRLRIDAAAAPGRRARSALPLGQECWWVLASLARGSYDLRTGWPPDPYTCTKCSLLDPGRGSGRSAALRFWRLHMTDDLVAVSWAKWRSAGDFVAAAQTAIDAVDSPQQRADIQSSLVPTPLSLLFKGSDFCKNAVTSRVSH